jgi:hypothetical protein
MKFLNKDYLYLVWQNPKDRNRIIIGELKKNGKYEFKYLKGVNEAIEEGFEPLIPFPDLKVKYINNVLFPIFSSRIPGPNRVDIDDILDKYNMVEYDEFELIRRSGAKTPIDNLEFIDPILNLRQENLSRDFFAAGTRYYCNQKQCEEEIKISDIVKLEKESANKKDKYAVKMYINDMCIGYIPKYYSKEITNFLNTNRNYKCYVISKSKNCEECIRVRLILNNKD